MNVLIDTSVWSLALRRARRIDDRIPGELALLIGEGRVVMLGAIRQELLSGIKIQHQFEQLRDHLRSFPDVAISMQDHEDAAYLFNRCRSHRIQGSNTDFLLCAVASRRKYSIFTTDADFQHYSRVVPIKLHSPRA